MDEFKVGDLVEAVKGDTVIRGRLNRSAGGEWWVGSSSRMYSGLLGSGFAVSLVERAQPELPTEPGLYLAYDKLSDAEFIAEWKDGALWWFGFPKKQKLGDPERFAPFTRLEPVAVTAKKVLERVLDLIDTGSMGTGSYSHVTSTVHQVELEFGVQS